MIHIIILIIIFIFIIRSTVYIPENNIALISRFGRYKKTLKSGLNLIYPFEIMDAKINLQIYSLKVHIESKTKDNVFIHITLSCQYKVIDSKAYIYWYEIDSPEQQMNYFIFDVVRAEVPKLTLDDVFIQKDQISKAINENLKETFNGIGINLLNCLIIDISPNEKVKAAMNKINEEQRLRIAAKERAEAEKNAIIIAAEAEAEKKLLHGKGIANERKAIIEGLRDSLSELERQGQDAEHAILLLIANQYFDTLKSMAEKSSSSTIFTSSNANGFTEVMAQLQENLKINKKQ